MGIYIFEQMIISREALYEFFLSISFVEWSIYMKNDAFKNTPFSIYKCKFIPIYVTSPTVTRPTDPKSTTF